MEYLTIKDSEFDNFSKEELATILVAFNDGDDQSVYTWEDIIDNITESDICIDGKNQQGSEIIKDLSQSKIIDLFYNGSELNGNNTRAVIFKEGKYWEIQWQSTY